MFTHYHQRHISTFYKISQYKYIRNVILPEPVNDTDRNVFNNVIEIANEIGCNVVIIPREEDSSVRLFDKVNVDLMKYTRLKRSTHPVLSLSFSVGEVKYLYAGLSVHEAHDINPADVDVIVFGRHGPILKSFIETGNKYDFLQYVIYGNKEIYESAKKFECDYTVHEEYSKVSIK